MRGTNGTQSWAQPTLFPANVLEITLRVGLVVDAEHAQIQYEVSDPSTGELLRMESRHHLDARDVLQGLEHFLEQLERDISAAVFPFPSE